MHFKPSQYSFSDIPYQFEAQAPAAARYEGSFYAFHYVNLRAGQTFNVKKIFSAIQAIRDHQKKLKTGIELPVELFRTKGDAALFTAKQVGKLLVSNEYVKPGLVLDRFCGVNNDFCSQLTNQELRDFNDSIQNPYSNTILICNNSTLRAMYETVKPLQYAQVDEVSNGRQLTIAEGYKH